jgi:hypothetical protein
MSLARLRKFKRSSLKASSTALKTIYTLLVISPLFKKKEVKE